MENVELRVEKWKQVCLLTGDKFSISESVQKISYPRIDVK